MTGYSDSYRCGSGAWPLPKAAETRKARSDSSPNTVRLLVCSFVACAPFSARRFGGEVLDFDGFDRYSVFYDDGDILDHRLVAERWKVRPRPLGA